MTRFVFAPLNGSTPTAMLFIASGFALVNGLMPIPNPANRGIFPWAGHLPVTPAALAGSQRSRGQPAVISVAM